MVLSESAVDEIAENRNSKHTATQTMWAAKYFRGKLRHCVVIMAGARMGFMSKNYEGSCPNFDETGTQISILGLVCYLACFYVLWVIH